MSIINDALKKAQANLNKKDKNENMNIYQKLFHMKENKPQAPTNEQKIHPPQHAAPSEKQEFGPIDISQKLKERQEARAKDKEKSQVESEKRQFWLNIMITFVAIIVILIGAFFALQNHPYGQDLSKKIKKYISSLQLQQTKRPKPAPPKKHYGPNEIILKGTMTMAEKQVALINDEAYEVGEFINGKEIINISLEKVELLENGVVTELRVKK